MIAMLVAVLSIGTTSMVLNSVKVQAQEEDGISEFQYTAIANPNPAGVTADLFDGISEIGCNAHASLSGKNEVPPNESNATGIANIQLNEDGSQYVYWVNTTGLSKITGAHIHKGSAGENGDVVVTLSKEKSAKDEDNPEIWFSGNITKDDLQGPLAGKGISDFWIIIREGAYVNIHTDEFTGGVVRGQLVIDEAQMEGMMEKDDSMSSMSEPGEEEPKDEEPGEEGTTDEKPSDEKS